MKQARVDTSVEPQQADRAQQIPTRLAECGDTVGIREICGVLGISPRELLRLRTHGLFPPPIPGLAHRWPTAIVQKFIEGRWSRAWRKVS